MVLSYKNDAEKDARLDPYSEDARRLNQRENGDIPGYDRANDGLDDHPITGGDASGKSGDLGGSNTKNIDGAKEREEGGGGWRNNYSGANNNTQKNKGWLSVLKKRGPLLGIIIGLVLGGGTLGFFGTALLPIAITESFINDTNDINSSQQTKTLHLFGGHKLGGKDVRKKMSICSSLISIRCKFNTLNDKTIQKFKDKGFSFGDELKSGNRTGFSSIKFPDGKVVTGIKELASHMDDPAASAAFNSVYSLKNNLFVVGNFMSGVLGKMGLSKAKKINGETKDEADKSYEEATKKSGDGGLSTSATPDEAGDDATEEQKKQAALNTEAGNDTARQINEAIAKGSKIKKLELKVSNALAIPQLICLTYNMTNVISVTAKTIKLARYAKFAMIFLSLAGSIKAGKATSAEVTKGTDILAPSHYPVQIEDENGDMIDNPNIGKNALDSEAYKVVTYGDSINLSGIAKRLFVAGGFLGILDKVVSWLNDHVGKRTIKTTCKIANSKVAKIISFLAAPIFGAVMYGVTQILPVDEWAASLVNLAIEAAAGLDLTTSITGVDAGNVLFIGTATVMGTAAMHYGLKPGKLAAIKKNLAFNNEINQRDIAAEKQEAQKAPFAINNRYSFLGSMAYGLAGYMPVKGQSPWSYMAKVLSAIPLSLSNLTKNASAAYTMSTANYSDTRFNQCTDETYKAMFDPDMFCVTRYVPAGSVDVNVATDYLKAQNQITDPDTTEGNAVPESNYEKYLKYCTDRTDPWGSTSVAAEEQKDDGRWYTGEKCLDDDTVDNQMYSEYTGYRISQDNIDATGNTAGTSSLMNVGGDHVADSNISLLSTVMHRIGIQ